ncbi:Phage capsid protein [Enterococcus faecalis FL2]|uniref:phage major capsid protein n=1 Tax=Enterococcus TaxID=1350 RepID=UPI00045A35E9|nr:phage major capsid protein [Enterococcus faecalis]EHS2293257.1 phage major capsid protein [Enterococcus faecalis]KAJ65337.1 Phage capsid protein [Enterococcus faecalis FL2]
MNIEELKKQAQEAIDSGDLEKARELMDKIKEFTAEANKAEEETRATEDKEKMQAELDAIKPVEKRSRSRKVEKRTLREVENLEDNQLEAFENFIRTEGVETRGLNTTNTSVVVPEDISTEVLELKDNLDDLSQYITVQEVGTGSGKFPVAKRATSVLATKEELAEIVDVDEPLFIEVDYKTETRIGKIMFSNELIEDSAIDVNAYSKKQMKRMVKNTNNKNILAILSSFTATTATDADGLKNVINVQLDPELDIKLLVNQDAYNYLDTLKDAEGRYLLQPSLSAPSGKQFSGHDVIVASNKLAPTPKDTVGFIFIGDLEEACILFKRKEITAEWEKFDSYSKGLAVGIRSDYKQVDPEAGFVVNLPVATDGDGGGETPPTTKAAKATK